MPSSLFPAAAWLSGLPLYGSAWMPIDKPPARHSADWMPTDNDATSLDASTMPIDKPPARHAADWMPTDPPRHPRTGSPWPWEGSDPPWTYAAPDTLLAQALRKSRSRLVLPGDPRSPPATPGTRPKPRDALWRWAPAFRVNAVTAELQSRCLVMGQQLLVAEVSSGPKVKLHRAYSVVYDDATFAADSQVDKVLRAAVEREDRMPEILTQAKDVWPFFEALVGDIRNAAPITADLFASAEAWSLLVLMALKNGIAARRPFQRSPLVVPVIPTPGHGSVPSGHAAVSAMIATLLSMLLYPPGDERARRLDRLARRIAFNRVVAGVHFPMDSWAGYRLGLQLAWLMRAWAEGGPRPAPVDVEIGRDTELPEAGAPPDLETASATLKAAPALKELWRAARAELERIRV